VPLGFFAMIGVLAAFNAYVYYAFIRNYVSSSYYWLAVFIYLFSPNLMLIQSSAMRQSVAIQLFLLAAPFISRKDFLVYILLVVLAITFHQSAFVLLPIFFLWMLPAKTSNRLTVLLGSAYFIFFSLKASLGTSIVNFLLAYFSKFSFYENNLGVELGSGAGYAFLVLLFFIILYYERRQTGYHSLFFRLFLIGFITSQTAFINALFARVGMYFEPFSIIVIPQLLISVRNPYFRVALLFCYLLFILYGFLNFFKLEVWVDSFSAYKTIFSSPRLF
jgi:transmembrane protein EpsG